MDSGAGVVYIQSRSNQEVVVTIEQITVIENMSSRGSVTLVSSGGSVFANITRSLFARNRGIGTSHGGALLIDVSEGAVLVSESDFTENHSGGSGKYDTLLHAALKLTVVRWCNCG